MRKTAGIVLGLLFSLQAAAAEASRMQIVVHAGSESEVLCQQLRDDLKVVTSGAVEGVCVGPLSPSEGYRSRVEVSRVRGGELNVRVDQFDLEDEADAPSVGWKITTADPMRQRETLAKMLKRFNDFQNHKKELRAMLLDGGIRDSQHLSVNEEGRYVEKRTGRLLDSEEAYRLFISEGVKQKNYLRAGFLIAAELGVATVNYYLTESNRKDWDYSGMMPALKSKLLKLQGMRFDDNSRYTNRDHAFAGAVYYLTARMNGLSSMESFLYNFAASAVWETICEYREVFSINDQIVTGIGGTAIGEAMYQLGRYFAQGPETGPRILLKKIFHSRERMMAWLEGRAPKRLDHSAEGFNGAISGTVDLYAGLDHAYQNDPERAAKGIRLGFDANVYNIPMKDQPGQVKQVLTDTVFARTFVELAENEEALNELQFQFKTTFAAYHEKNLKYDEQGKLRGYSFFVGPSSAVSYRENFSDRKGDFLTIVNVAGGTLHGTYYINGVRIQATFDVFGDFALVRSWALDKYVASRGTAAGMPTVLTDHGYYYGAGITQALALKAEFQQFQIGGSVSHDGFKRIRSRDRYQAAVTDNPEMADDITEAEMWIGYRISDRTRVKLTLNKVFRHGTAEEEEQRSTKTRIGIVLIYTF